MLSHVEFDDHVKIINIYKSLCILVAQFLIVRLRMLSCECYMLISRISNAAARSIFRHNIIEKVING